MNQKKFFGPKLYVVHESLEIIVEGNPLIKRHRFISNHDQSRNFLTKFGNFYGSFLQFKLYDITKTEPELKICVDWDCRNCYVTKKEAVAALTKILENNVKGYRGDKINIQGQIEDLHDDIKDIDADIREIKKKIKQLNEN